MSFFSIIKRFLNLISLVISIFGTFVFFRLNNFKTTTSISDLIILVISQFCLFASLGIFICLTIITRTHYRKHGLTRDRWHTMFPKLVISSVVLVLIPFPLLCFVFFKRMGFCGIIMVALGYNIILQLGRCF